MNLLRKLYLGGLLFGSPAAEHYVPDVSTMPKAQEKQIGTKKEHATEKGDQTENYPHRREPVPPGNPYSGKSQKSHEVDVELSRPGHFGDIGEKDRQQVPTVLGTNQQRVTSQDQPGDGEVKTKESHGYLRDVCSGNSSSTSRSLMESLLGEKFSYPNIEALAWQDHQCRSAVGEKGAEVVENCRLGIAE